MLPETVKSIKNYWATELNSSATTLSQNDAKLMLSAHNGNGILLLAINKRVFIRCPALFLQLMAMAFEIGEEEPCNIGNL